MQPAQDPHEAATRLVARARSGDRRAFGELVRRYRGRIFALSLHLTGQESDADDVTQDVFLKAYRALPRFEGRSHFFSWVYRMAVNLSLNARRDRRRRGETALDDPRIERALLVDGGDNPAEIAQLRQTYARLLGALDRLPLPMRTSVVLVALQGLSHAEVAVVQGCSSGTVAWHLHEARRRLRAALRPGWSTVRRGTTGALTGRGGARARSSAAGVGRSQLSGELTELLREWGLPVWVGR